MPRFAKPILAVSLMLAAACGGDPSPPGDAGPTDANGDTGGGENPPEIPWLEDGEPPVELTPCPRGWREVVVGDVTECEPYPGTGPEACGAGEAHFPGEAACRPIGDPCPAGDYADDLPPGDTIIYVKEGAAAGGDGSLAAPFGALEEVNWLTAGTGTTVAIAKGTYPGRLPLRAGARVIGACVEETRLPGTTAPAPAAVTVVSAGAAAEVRNIAIVGAPQYGALITSGRGLGLRGVLIEGARELGIAIDEAGSTLALEDVVVRDTRPNESNAELGRGMIVQGGSRVDAARFLVTGNRGLGIFVSGTGTVAALADTAVVGTLPALDDNDSGGGAMVRRGGRLEATRMLVAENHDVGIRVTDAASTATLTDVIIRDTASQNDQNRGQGLYVQEGGAAEATRLVVRDNHFIGVMVEAAPSAVTLVDSVIRDTLPRAGGGTTGGGGRGIEVQYGARLDATRLLVTDNRDVAVTVTAPGTTTVFTDVLVRDTLPMEEGGTGGRGLQVQDDAQFEGTRIVVETTKQLGLMAVDGAEVRLRDVSIGHVERATCGTACEGEGFGYGASAVSATLVIERFHIHHAATCGVFVAAPAELGMATSLDLLGGVISDSAIGACVQVDGYDVGRLSTGVTYRDNDSNLDATMLPVPGVEGAAGP